MGGCCESRRPRRQRRWTSLTCMDSSFQLLTRAASTAGVIGDGVDAGRTPPTVGCRTRETEWGERGRSSPRADTVRGELQRGERLSYDFIAGQRMGERRSSPRVNNVSGRGARREAANLRLSRRPAHGEENAACPGCVASALGEAARREAASLLSTADRRMSKLRPGCVSAMPRA